MAFDPSFLRPDSLAALERCDARGLAAAGLRTPVEEAAHPLEASTNGPGEGAVVSAFVAGPAAAAGRPLALRLPHGDDEETRDKEGNLGNPRFPSVTNMWCNRKCRHSFVFVGLSLNLHGNK